MLSRAIRALFAVTGLFCLTSAPVQGALTSEQLICQGKVAKSGRTYVKTRVKALSACQDAINTGTLPVGTDCTLATKTSDKLDKAEQKLRDKIAGGCTDRSSPRSRGAARAAALRPSTRSPTVSSKSTSPRRTR
jgi:hypothetical protein